MACYHSHILLLYAIIRCPEAYIYTALCSNTLWHTHPYILLWFYSYIAQLKQNQIFTYRGMRERLEKSLGYILQYKRETIVHMQYTIYHCKKYSNFNLSVVITVKYKGNFNHLVVIAVGILQPTV